MMWSQILLCLLVGFAFASDNPGWKENSEYVYNIHSRTLASLHEVADQYSGIIFKSDLRIQPRPDGKLQCQISDPQYSYVHSHLSDGWNTDIPDSEARFKPLKLSNQPFQIDMSGGLIQDLIVNKDIPNWEANMIKGIASQFQLNTNGINLLPSKLNTLPEEGQDSGVFKTMEETVTGKTETMYDIHPMPEYVLQSKPWMAKYLDLKGGDGEVIEVVKHKNYSNNEELPLYHYGLGGIGDWYPGTNQMGHFFIRDSISRAILTGTLKRYTVQNSYTVNGIVMSPTFNNKQKGSVVSSVNVTLHKISSNGQPIGDVPNPLPLGNLVYTYDDPESHSVSQKRSSDDEESNFDDRYSRSATMRRIRRAIKDNQDSYGSDSSQSSEEDEYYLRSQPQLKKAPRAPLLPYTTGYKGMSIKDDPSVNIKKSVEKIAKEIGNNLQNPEEFLRENTLDKFTTMTSLIRLLDAQELKQVAADLYNQNQNGPQRDTWIAFRDSVAECGTGPALLAIQEWIQSGKIQEFEAAQIVTTMADSVREPTEEYMKSFFEFIKNPKVLSQKYLNDTCILSYSNLVREVYVDWEQSSRQYPVNTYGKFRTSGGKQFVEETVIPYYTHQLQEAIAHASTHKIHTYIRALGNVGHQKILPAFEPFLEGEKQASQFQRLLMVMAMDRLTETKPKVARSVLYKIYQNAGESQEVRVAAVYQLMRTSPPTDMLQRMASYTNMDSHNHVNAAVKSSIQHAAQLEGEEYQWLRSSAEAARPLLNKKDYGVQHGHNHLRNFVVDELNLHYKQSAQYIGSEEQFYPKGLRYSISDNLGGLKSQLATLQAMVSSTDELIHMVQYQMASYQQQQQKQQQNAQQQKQNQFSSLNIARLLNMKSDEREQLEGSLYTELYDSFCSFLSFDNYTMEQLPEEIRKFEEEIKNGKSYHHVKYTNNKAIALSFPTESGLPFLFTYDAPMVVKVEGHLSGSSSPQFSDGGKLHKPDTITLKAEMGWTINVKGQSRLSFTTPCDGQRYIAGFDKNFQVHVPLDGNFKIDVKNAQIEAEIENKEIHKDARLFHYSTWPYTSRVDIKKFQPIAAQPNTHYIQQDNLRSYDKIFGKKHTGMAWRVQLEHERQFINIHRLRDLMHSPNVVTGLAQMWNDAAIQYGQINVQLLPEQSTAQKYVIRAGYESKYQAQSKQNQAHSPNWSHLYSISDPLARRESLIDTVGAGINSAKINVLDASVEFHGSKNIKYSVVGGVGKSDVDPKSRVMIFYKKSSDSQDEKPYELSLEANSYIPNTNGLDLEEAFKVEPMADSTVQVKFGQNLQSPSTAEGKFELRRSEERKQYLQEQPMYKQCEQEMREGDNQLPACANMTMNANLLDCIKVSVHYENMKQEVLEAIKSAYEAFKVYYYPTLEVDRSQGTGQPNQVNLNAHFDPDLRSVNISIQTKDQQMKVNTLQVNEWAQKVFVVHPVFHLRSRVFGAALGLKTYRPICVVDQTYASSFNNRTYPAPLDKYWTLMLQYVPKDARHTGEQISVEEQFKFQPEHYAVLVRQNPGSPQQRDVKITLSSPETDYKVIDITQTPGSGGKGAKAKVTVNGQEVQVNDQQSYSVKDGYIQIYSLPNGEVKVEIDDTFYTVYDGHRVKLSVVNGQFRDSTRGLCGSFTDDQSNDFLTSENCIARDYHQFIKSYEVEGSQGQQQRKMFAGRTSQCVPQESPLYANVISDQDAGRSEQSKGYGRAPKGTKFQTRYVELDGEICFTIHPVPACNSRQQQHGTVRKSVPVHCVQKSNVAQLWKNQIDRGASPDFSHKKQTKSVQIELPQRCS